MAVSMTISEAAEASGLTAHTLRYYERAGLLEPVGREAGGRRRYDDADLTRIAFLTKLRATPEKLTPDDFRLRPDSAGYKAGKDGKDLGADVDLVGPGPAYERWKKTPEYQQWLKDTAHVKK